MGSQLKVDTITGVTTAGSVAVTGEGNSTTTNLQQGLLKAYVCYTTSSSTAIHGSESFNHSSLSDEGTGATKFTMTNPMSASKFSLSDSGGDGSAGYSSWVEDDDFSTSTYELHLGTGSFNSQDGPYHAGQVIGELA